MPLPTEFGDPIRVSATGTVMTGPGVVVGVVVNASTSGTLTLRDATSATGTPFVNALSVTAGSFVPLKIAFTTGLHLTLGGTGDVTFVIAR